MIADFKTNTVYIADCTPKAYKERLEKIGIDYKVLYGTADYYCRDYMPVQIAEKEFVQFIYRPEEYLAEDDYKCLTNPIQVELRTKLESTLGQFKYSGIILDGGNVIRADDKVIITDKVYDDNIFQFNNKKVEIHKELEKVLKCQVIIIPRYPIEKSGHADGLVRFIDNTTVIVNEEGKEDPIDWLNDFYAALNRHHLEIKVKMKCAVDPKELYKPKGKENAIGLYINFLQLDHQIIVPRFDKKADDDAALENIKTAFGTGSGYNYQQMFAGDIAKYGGVLNCATWTIYIPKK